MLVTYILLVIFSGLSVGYEFYMGFACVEHDCMEKLLVNVTPSGHGHLTVEDRDGVV